MIYQYKCSDCNEVFEIDIPMSEQKDPWDCAHCHKKDSAKQFFDSSRLPSVKIWDNPIEKLITYDIDYEHER